MTKYFSIGVAALVALSFTACKADDQNAVAFQAAAKTVVAVKNIIIPGDGALDAKLTALGGYPAAADVATSKKAVDVQYSIGYDANKKAIVAVSLAKDGTLAVVVDPDLLQGYVAKVKTLTGEKSTVTTSSSSSGSGSSGGGDSNTDGTAKNLPGCPVKIGMSKAQAKSALHGQIDQDMNEGTDHEVWLSEPIQAGTLGNDLANTATSQMGMVGSLFGGSVNSAQHHAIKEHTYFIYFGGDTVVRLSLRSS